MNKRISAALLAAIITLTLAGCSSGTTSSGSSSTAESSVSSETSSADSESAVTSEVSDSGVTSDTSAADGTSAGSGEAPSGNNDGVDNSGLEFPDTKAGRMVKAALATDAWGYMDLGADQEYVSALFSEEFVLEDCEEYCFTSSTMSTQLLKVAVIKPKEGKEEEFTNAIEHYLEYAKEGAAFYPAQEESAAGAVSGKTDDGYLYLVVHKNGEDIANAMLAAE